MVHTMTRSSLTEPLLRSAGFYHALVHSSLFWRIRRWVVPKIRDFVVPLTPSRMSWRISACIHLCEHDQANECQDSRMSLGRGQGGLLHFHCWPERMSGQPQD